MAMYDSGEEPDSALGRLFYYSEAGNSAPVWQIRGVPETAANVHKVVRFMRLMRFNGGMERSGGPGKPPGPSLRVFSNHQGQALTAASVSG